MRLNDIKVDGLEHGFVSEGAKITGLTIDGFTCRTRGDGFILGDLIDARFSRISFEKVDVEFAINEMLKHEEKRSKQWLKDRLPHLSPDKLLAAWELWEKVRVSLGL